MEVTLETGATLSDPGTPACASPTATLLARNPQGRVALRNARKQECPSHIDRVPLPISHFSILTSQFPRLSDAPR